MLPKPDILTKSNLSQTLSSFSQSPRCHLSMLWVGAEHFETCRDKSWNSDLREAWRPIPLCSFLPAPGSAVAGLAGEAPQALATVWSSQARTSQVGARLWEAPLEAQLTRFL